ncbi:15180_t:CDS:2, partial [Racocetra persica]
MKTGEDQRIIRPIFTSFTEIMLEDVMSRKIMSRSEVVNEAWLKGQRRFNDTFNVMKRHARINQSPKERYTRRFCSLSGKYATDQKE